MPGQTFSLGRIIANFVFLCEKTLRLQWGDLSERERIREAGSNALAYLTYKPTPSTFKIAIRIPGEVIDLGNGSAFMEDTKKNDTSRVSLHGVDVDMFAVPSLAQEQIRMVLEETDLAPWAAAGKTEKRTCRMLLSAIWSALLHQ